MKQTKPIISTVVVLMAAIHGANAVVCKPANTPPGCVLTDKGVVCEKLAPPLSCENYDVSGNGAWSAAGWSVSGCTGGGFDRFEGMSRCFDTGGTHLTEGDPGSVDGQYCWCALTSPAAPVLVWIYLLNHGSTSTCFQSCADSCAYDAQSDSAFRSALFNAIGQ
jgi:hypothetical protein